MSVIANEPINENKLSKARQIISDLQAELSKKIETEGCGPFLAAIFDEKGNLITKAFNSVVIEKCSHNHAEMNVIKKAEKIFNTYDLAPFNLSLYVTSEPCLMCLGGIMWSGIKAVYYGVSSKDVEQITCFDEGFKHSWLDEFKNRGISVYGQIEEDLGKKVLKTYVQTGKTVYKPSR